MIAVTKKMRRLGATKLTYGRDITVYQDSKLTDKGMVRFHSLPTFCKITVHYANGDTEEMTKATFEVLANLKKCDNFMEKHFVD